MEFSCAACGMNFPSREALRSHAKKKVAEESRHYRDMLAHNQTEPIYPDTQEKPS